MVPQLNDVHKAPGSRPLRFGGIEPTGSLPEAINAPLIGDGAGDRFQPLVLGGAPPQSNMKISCVGEAAGRGDP